MYTSEVNALLVINARHGDHILYLEEKVRVFDGLAVFLRFLNRILLQYFYILIYIIFVCGHIWHGRIKHGRLWEFHEVQSVYYQFYYIRKY